MGCAVGWVYRWTGLILCSESHKPQSKVSTIPGSYCCFKGESTSRLIQVTGNFQFLETVKLKTSFSRWLSTRTLFQLLQIPSIHHVILSVCKSERRCQILLMLHISLTFPSASSLLSPARDPITSCILLPPYQTISQEIHWKTHLVWIINYMKACYLVSPKAAGFLRRQQVPHGCISDIDENIYCDS